MKNFKKTSHIKTTDNIRKTNIFEMQSIKNRHNDHADILSAIANGKNPITGENLPNGVLDHPEIILALASGSSALRNIAASINISGSKSPKNAGLPWTKQDEEILLEAYTNGEPLDLLAIDFGRTEKAIEKRLELLLSQQDKYTSKTHSLRIRQRRKRSE